MANTIKKAQFRADHVGSLLRPQNLLEARDGFFTGKISQEKLREVETQEIRRIVDKQIEIGLEAVTDGEFRRTWWHLDFLEHLNGIEGYIPNEGGQEFVGGKTDSYNVRNVGKVSWNPDHPFVKDFIEFNEIVNGRAVAKLTIPSPNQLFHLGIHSKEVYPDINKYADDIILTYRDAIQTFYKAGVRYIQFDDPYTARLSQPESPLVRDDYTREQLIDLALRVINGVLDGKPKDLYVTTHLCRGNYRSTWAFEGSYALVAPTLFAKEKYDGFFLEYDDDRSGDFDPLKHIPNGGAKVVLGLITSKTGELEDKELILARIKEASQYVPLDQLCLSPQCGFSSTHHGNHITEEQQWAKLKFVVDIAKEVWG